MELWLQDHCEFAQASRNWTVDIGRKIRSKRGQVFEHVQAICEMHGLSDKIGKETYATLAPKNKKGKWLDPAQSSVIESLWTEASQDPRFERWSHCIKHVSNEAIKSQCESFKKLKAGTGGQPRLRPLSDGRSFKAVRSSEVGDARERTEEKEDTTKAFKLTPGRTPQGKYRKYRQLTLPKMHPAGLKPIRLAESIPHRICYDNISEIKIVRTRKGNWEAHIVWQDGVYPERRKPQQGTGVDLGACVIAAAQNATTGENRMFLPPDGEKQYLKQRRRLQRKLAEHLAEKQQQHKRGTGTLPGSTQFDENGKPYYDKHGNPILGKGRKQIKLETAIAELDEKWANRRNNEQRLMARRIVDNADLLIIEELKPKNMRSKKPGQGKRGRKANRKISQGAIGRSRDLLVQKAHESGVPVVMLNWNAPSSKTCSQCHAVNKHARREGSRDFACAACGLIEDSDFNAAVNISAAGKHAASQVARPAPDKTPGLADWQVCDVPKRRRKPLDGLRGKAAYATVPGRTETTWGCLGTTDSNTSGSLPTSNQTPTARRTTCHAISIAGKLTPAVGKTSAARKTLGVISEDKQDPCCICSITSAATSATFLISTDQHGCICDQPVHTQHLPRVRLLLPASASERAASSAIPDTSREYNMITRCHDQGGSNEMG